MKLRARLLMLSFLVGLQLPVNKIISQESSNSSYYSSDCYTENIAFEQGERVVYKVYYNWNFVWLSAGEVTFEVSETDNEYRISAIGRTYPSYEWFFKVRDYYYTYIDKETFLPHTFIRDVEEGSYTLYDKIQFDQVSQTGTSFRGKNKDEAKLQDFQFDDCMHDMLSIVYKMRNMDFNKMPEGSKIPVTIFLDMEEYPLDIKYDGRVKDKKVRGLGTYNAIQITPEVIAGNVFNEDAEMKIWVSDDKNRVPLIIESPVSVGSVKVVLKEYENLKHPLSSKTE